MNIYPEFPAQRSSDTRAVPPTGRIWPPSARRSWSLASPGIASTATTAAPARPAPGPASPRPSPPCAKTTSWSRRNSTGWPGPSRIRAPSPTSFGNEA